MRLIFPLRLSLLFSLTLQFWDNVAATTSPSIVGTYNTTFWSFSLPSCLVEALVPEQYVFSLPEPDASGKIPVVIELGHETDSGPPGLQILDFQEAKIEVPSMRRVNSSSIGFTHKTRILVDNLIDVPSSFLIYGLSTSFTSFIPINSLLSSLLDYNAQGSLSVSDVREDESPSIADSTFEENAGQPWFGDYLQCGKHVYDFPNATGRQRVKGTMTVASMLFRENTCQGVVNQSVVVPNVEGLHIVASWGIYGPSACSDFI